MKRGETGAAEEWQRSILTLPDSVFFDLMKNYLGDVSTPFNKHALIRRLVKFLKQRETSSRITALLDQHDRQILTVVKILGSPTFEEIYYALEEGISYLNLQRALVNLERRLLLFREPIGHAIRLNPLLEPTVSRKALHPRVLFISHSVEIWDAEKPWMDESLLAAFLSFVLHEGLALRKSGSLTSRSEEAVLRVFPALEAFEEGVSRLGILIGSLENLGLLRREGNVLKPDLREWERLASLDTSDALVYLWSSGGQLDSGAQKRDSVPAGRLAIWLRILLSHLSTKEGIDETSLMRLGKVIAIKSRENPDNLPAAPQISDFLRHLKRLGLLASAETSHLVVNPHVPLILAGERHAGTVTALPNFEIVLTAEVNLRQGMPVALSSQIRSHDLVCSYELNRSSFQTYLNMGYRADDLLKTLERENQKLLPQNLLATIAAWQEEFEALALYEGVVLTVVEKSRELVEHVLEPYIRRKLEEGVYLLDSSEENRWRRLLAKSGFEYVPEVQRLSQDGRERISADSVLNSFGSPSVELFPEWEHDSFWDEQNAEGIRSDENRTDEIRTDEIHADEIRTDLLAELESIADRYTPQQIDEVRRRIEEKLIILKGLIRPISSRGETYEAKGLDYLGKLRLIEQAIREESVLEIIERTAAGRPRKLEMKPLRIEKSQTQSASRSDLVLVGRVIPTAEEISVKVSKMGLVRRIPSSLLSGF